MERVVFKICNTQSKIYEYAVNLGYEIKSFSDNFLKSTFCKESFDTIYSRFQLETPMECMDFILPEIKESLVLSTSEQEQACVAGDIGFMYRLLYIETSVPSVKLAEIVPFDEMAKMALNFDHYGFEECVNEIIEKYHLPRQECEV